MASSVVAAMLRYRSFPPFSYVPTHTAKLLRKHMLLLGKEDDDHNTFMEIGECKHSGGSVWGHLCGLHRDILMWALSKLMFFHWTSDLVLHQENATLDLKDSCVFSFIHLFPSVSLPENG